MLSLGTLFSLPLFSSVYVFFSSIYLFAIHLFSSIYLSCSFFLSLTSIHLLSIIPLFSSIYLLSMVSIFYTFSTFFYFLRFLCFLSFHCPRFTSFFIIPFIFFVLSPGIINSTLYLLTHTQPSQANHHIPLPSITQNIFRAFQIFMYTFTKQLTHSKADGGCCCCLLLHTSTSPSRPGNRTHLDDFG